MRAYEYEADDNAEQMLDDAGDVGGDESWLIPVPQGELGIIPINAETVFYDLTYNQLSEHYDSCMAWRRESRKAKSGVTIVQSVTKEIKHLLAWG